MGSRLSNKLFICYYRLAPDSKQSSTHMPYNTYVVYLVILGPILTLNKEGRSTAYQTLILTKRSAVQSYIP